MSETNKSECQKIFDKKYTISDINPIITGFKDIMNDYASFRKCAKIQE